MHIETIHFLDHARSSSIQNTPTNSNCSQILPSPTTLKTTTNTFKLDAYCKSHSSIQNTPTNSKCSQILPRPTTLKTTTNPFKLDAYCKSHSSITYSPTTFKKSPPASNFLEPFF